MKTARYHYQTHATIEGVIPDTLAAHAEQSVTETLRRMGSTNTTPDAIGLHIVDSPWEYKDRLGQLGIPAFPSAGLFYATPESKGIVLGTRDVPVHDVMATVRHECLHHAVNLIYDNRLPIWVNEGLAQYFEDGIWLNGKLKLSNHNTERLAHVVREFELGHSASFLELAKVPHEVWLCGDESGQIDVGWLYRWSWTYVTTFIAGPSKKVRNCFLSYLKLLRKPDSNHNEAWKATMADLTLNEIHDAVSMWLEKEKSLELSGTVHKLAIVGMFLAFMMRENLKLPKSLDELRNRSRMLGLKLARQLPGPAPEYYTLNDDVLFYDSDDGIEVELEFEEAANNRVPPSLSAPLIEGSPRIEWVGKAHKILPWVRVGDF